MAAWNLKREMRPGDWFWVFIPILSVVSILVVVDAQAARSRKRVERLCADTLFGATPHGFIQNALDNGFKVRSEPVLVTAYLVDYSPFPLEDRCEAKHNGKRITGLTVVTARK